METALLQWLKAELPNHPHIQLKGEPQLTPLGGDAGLRHYHRVNTQPSLLAVSAPRTDGNSEHAGYFADLSRRLRNYGIPTPRIIACNDRDNCLLIEDFGEQTFLQVLNADTVDLLYSEALMVLLRWQQIPRSALAVADYSQPLLREEMDLFPRWFVRELLGVNLSATETKMLAATFTRLEQQALEQPQVLVHRDYHSRNLIYRGGGAPGVIDFQDAVWGPITYDLVSLLRDCYIHWPPRQVKRWMTTYANMAIEVGLMPVTTEARWQQWFDFMGLQRHLKVLGIFARLNLRDGKPGYLDDLPLVWHYMLAVAGDYGELSDFYSWCTQALLPVVKQQQWYREITPSE